jgi:hypothetical protein
MTSSRSGRRGGSSGKKARSTTTTAGGAGTAMTGVYICKRIYIGRRGGRCYRVQGPSQVPVL